MSFLVVVVVLVALMSQTFGYQTFRSSIPNGENVPNPCNKSILWNGVGHENSAGQGPLNPFGKDFKANNKVWNRTICQMDSDGDGKPNGLELGDPNCTWTPGRIPSYTTNISHPGVCNPIDSPTCTSRNAWLMNCSPGKFNCSAINGPDVKSFTVKFPPTPVPTNETTYICVVSQLPNISRLLNVSSADMIAMEPAVDNAQILHHMLLFGCTEEPTELPSDRPFLCGMSNGMSCMSLIGVWGVGISGQCLDSQLGFRIGAEGFRYAMLQLHWNNPERKPNLTDSSGMKIYFTPKPRPNKGEIFWVGQNFLKIPAQQQEVTFFGGCSSSCTAQMHRSVWLTTALIHMHMIGKAGNVRLFRNDTLLYVLEEMADYDYNSPRLVQFPTPIEMKPGDRVDLKCVYNSSSRQHATSFGEATSDEMCLAFFTYYPQLPELNFCGRWKTINICSNKNNPRFDSCDLPTFLKLLNSVPGRCSDDCSDKACTAILQDIFANGCNRYADVRSFVQTFMGDYGSILAYCSLAYQQPSTMINDSPGLRLTYESLVLFGVAAYANYRYMF